MEEKFLIEIFKKNPITQDYEKVGEETCIEFPDDKKLKYCVISHDGNRVKISKIYDFDDKKNKVHVSYSDMTSEVIPLEKLDVYKLKEILAEGNEVKIQRFGNSWG